MNKITLDDRFMCKAISIDTGKFVEGLPVHIHCTNGVDTDRICIMNKELGIVPIHLFSLCRYIGKIDSNGNRVYENDYVDWKSTAYYSNKPYLVKYNNDTCGFILVTERDRIPIFDSLEVTVVGNFYLEKE